MALDFHRVANGAVPGTATAGHIYFESNGANDGLEAVYVTDTGGTPRKLDAVTSAASAAAISAAITAALAGIDQTAAGTSFDNVASGMTATNVKAALEELNTGLTGVAHTAITGIDLKAGGGANEFLVEITWTDGDGNAQTTTDPTPITVATVGYSTETW